jgi:hypothetical protein
MAAENRRRRKWRGWLKLEVVRRPIFDTELY